jgi:RNA polymerase sigma factor (TIGR02999 family)
MPNQPPPQAEPAVFSKQAAEHITTVLQAADSRGSGCEALLPLVYQELRQMAAARMAQEAAQTLQATALVHEAWLRLFNGNARVWQNRQHFFAAAAQAMRRILIERARRKLSLKRGGGQEILNIEDLNIAESPPDERILLIDEALERLKAKDPELAKVVTLKFFGGLTNAEVADMLGVTERTVDNKWAFAKAWLMKNIREKMS